MEDNCFCQTDKYINPTVWDMICRCLCIAEKENIIKLNCCGNYVHRSCFINSAIIYSNNIINSKDTPETTKLSEIRLCHYCRKPYDKSQFPIIPYTNEEFILGNKIISVVNTIDILNVFIILFSLCIGLCDNILLASNNNKGMELYEKIFINNCKTNYTGSYNNSKDISDYCSNLFYMETEWKIWVVILTSVIGFIVYMSCVNYRCRKIIDYNDYIFELLKLKSDSILEYKEIINKINKYKNLDKKMRINLIIQLLELLWQLVYLVIIIGYNVWYIPSHTSSETTQEEARKLVLNYLPILCFFNIYWNYIIIGIVLLCIGWRGSIGESFSNQEEKSKEEKSNELNKNKIIEQRIDIKLYSIDVDDDSLKKSNIV